MFKGFATLNATQNYFKNHPLHASNVRNFCGVKVSSLGLGTYLGSMDENTDMLVTKACLEAFQGGVNLFDTAINYRGQRAERSIREFIKRGLLSKAFSREEVFISTKGGFVPYEGVPVRNMKELFEQEYVSKGIAQSKDLISECHCIEPAYISNQIERSRENLGLETIDLYYLHNPETQLDEISNRLFYDKLLKAFELLEGQIKDGKIKNYGLATWDAFRVEETEQVAVSIEKAKAIALQAAKSHGFTKDHFAAIQLPLNLAMPEGALLASQSIHKSIEETTKLPIINAARELGIDVAISAPLLQSRLSHGLPDFILNAFPEDYSQTHCSLSFASSFPAVNTVMVGMKQSDHIKHNLEYLGKNKLSQVQLEKVIEAMMENNS